MHGAFVCWCEALKCFESLKRLKKGLNLNFEKI
jgi:hypothetical protein